MRLICPNCGAQYEVDDSLIPDGGRDVQCSNCGHAWFQQPAELDSELADELGTDAGDLRPGADAPDLDSIRAALVEAPGPAAAPGSESAPESALESASAPDSAATPRRVTRPLGSGARRPETGDGTASDSASGAPPRPAGGAASRLDPSVRDILMEEASREAKARRAEDRIETQDELGLDQSPAPRSRRPAAPAQPSGPAALPGDTRESAPEPTAGTPAGSRRALLPDIEEINSSLRPAHERGEEDMGEPLPEPRSGFGTGFMLVLVLALLAVVIYAFADTISTAVPAIEPALSAYVAWVDGLRIWLDGVARGWVEALRS